MSTDASRKLIGFHIYQEFCRMFPMGHGKVNPVEMSPFLMTMRLIKQFYGFSKPEVYSTLIALLQDYDPSLGVKHRERTMRYIKLLLVDQPDLADYLLYLLPECVKSNDNEESQQQQQHQQQQPSKCIHCSSQTVRCEKRPTAESLREEPSHSSSSLLQRMVVLPASESFKDFTTTAVRIAPAINSVAGITTTASNSVLAFGKNAKIALPHLVKNAAGQMKQLQVQSKPGTTLGTILYSPNIVIKSEILSDASSIVTLPRISSTVAGTTIPINAVQDAGNPLARHLGLKLATHITSLPKDGTSKAALSSGKAPLIRAAPKTVVESSGSGTLGDSLDSRLENLIRKFGKETQTSTGMVIGVHQKAASTVPSTLFCPKLSCIRNTDTKETIVVQKQQESVGRSTHTSVTNALLRCMPAFPQSQPMFVIEKTSRNITTSSFDNTAGIRIIKKGKVSTSGLPLLKLDKAPPATTTVSESSPLISLKKLVAGVGLLKSVENEAVNHSPTAVSNRDAVMGSIACERAAVCAKLEGEPVEATESGVAKESDHLEASTSSLKSLLDDKDVDVQEKQQENATRLNADSSTPVLLEISSDKEVFRPCGLSESDGRLSPYSDETSHSLMMNDGTSDYHASDEELTLPTGCSTTLEINDSKCPEPSQINATSAVGFEAQPSDEEPVRKKMRVATSTDDTSQYEGRTYLARLMELPSPPNYERENLWDLVPDDRKKKGKIAVKRKRKK